jgi:hypothetical protein
MDSCWVSLTIGYNPTWDSLQVYNPKNDYTKSIYPLMSAHVPSFLNVDPESCSHNIPIVHWLLGVPHYDSKKQLVDDDQVLHSKIIHWLFFQ